MESVLAMMVVICGVILVTTSLTFVGIDLRRDSGKGSLQEGCGSLLDQLLALGPPFFDGEVLQRSSLGLLNASLFHAINRIDGYCITLMDTATRSSSEVIFSTGGMTAGNETYALSAPLLVSMPDRTVHSAKATVMVW
jgi:hypothetical protein